MPHGFVLISANTSEAIDECFRDQEEFIREIELIAAVCFNKYWFEEMSPGVEVRVRTVLESKMIPVDIAGTWMAWQTPLRVQARRTHVVLESSINRGIEEVFASFGWPKPIKAENKVNFYG